MDATVPQAGEPRDTLSEFRSAVADDLLLFALLHDREPDNALLTELKSMNFPSCLGLRLRSKPGLDAGKQMQQALSELTLPVEDGILDGLAADYADIYLTHGYRAAPNESVWLDEDNLERQRPMFEIRQWYRRHDLAAADWRRRPDDHLVPQLQFTAYLVRHVSGVEGLKEAVDFLDRHLLRWVLDFSSRVAGRCDSRFFAGLALLTGAYLDELRDVLADFLEAPRPQPQPQPQPDAA